MESIALSQNVLDLLSKYLPGIEYLICADYGFTNAVDEEIEETKEITIALDMIELRSL